MNTTVHILPNDARVVILKTDSILSEQQVRHIQAAWRAAFTGPRGEPAVVVLDRGVEIEIITAPQMHAADWPEFAALENNS